MNTGACRTRAGAERAAKILDESIDGIAREHFKGHTDPRDYKPGVFERPIEQAKAAALTAWRSIRESVIERMVSAAAEPEAVEIRRRRIEEERINRETEERRKRQQQERRVQRAMAREQEEAQSRKSPKSDQGPGCVFRCNPITDSGATRSPIPAQADHRFRSNPITDSGPKPITFRR